MKRLMILCVFCALCGPIQGANEIHAFDAGATTCFAVVRNVSGQVWYPVGLVFEAWGTGARTAADYDLALTNKTGGMFVGNMDTNVAAGQYYIVSHQQVGGAPANTDPAIWQEYGDWTGTVWTPGTNTPGDIADSVWDEPMAGHTAELTFGGELQTLDPNITLILADTSELQTDWHDGGRLDLLIDAIKAVTDILPLVTTTVSAADDANSFTVAAGQAVTDAFLGDIIRVTDVTDGHAETRLIIYWSSARVVEVDRPFTFIPAVSDPVTIWSVCYWGELWEMIERDDSVTNIFDLTGGTSRGMGMTIFDSTGEDP